MKFQFKTSATMKPYNNKNWWIDSGIIKEITVNAENIQKALEQYRKTVHDTYYINISTNALKTKSAMFIDDKKGFSHQCGYIITAKTEFDKGDYTGYSSQYIDLWVTVAIILNPFEEV